MRRCPFCGGEPVVKERYRNGTPNRKMYWIECKSCGISQAHHDNAGYRTPAKAERAWNKVPWNKGKPEPGQLVLVKMWSGRPFVATLKKGDTYIWDNSEGGVYYDKSDEWLPLP